MLLSTNYLNPPNRMSFHVPIELQLFWVVFVSFSVYTVFQKNIWSKILLWFDRRYKICQSKYQSEGCFIISKHINEKLIFRSTVRRFSIAVVLRISWYRKLKSLQLVVCQLLNYSSGPDFKICVDFVISCHLPFFAENNRMLSSWQILGHLSGFVIRSCQLRSTFDIVASWSRVPRAFFASDYFHFFNSNFINFIQIRQCFQFCIPVYPISSIFIILWHGLVLQIVFNFCSF